MPRCLQCGYDLRGLELPHRCPECGLLAETPVSPETVAAWFTSPEGLSCISPPSGFLHCLEQPACTRIARRRLFRYVLLPWLSLAALTLALNCVVVVHTYDRWKETTSQPGIRTESDYRVVERRAFAPSDVSDSFPTGARVARRTTHCRFVPPLPGGAALFPVFSSGVLAVVGLLALAAITNWRLRHHPQRAVVAPPAAALNATAFLARPAAFLFTLYVGGVIAFALQDYLGVSPTLRNATHLAPRLFGVLFALWGAAVLNRVAADSRPPARRDRRFRPYFETLLWLAAMLLVIKQYA